MRREKERKKKIYPHFVSELTIDKEGGVDFFLHDNEQPIKSWHHDQRQQKQVG